MKCSFTFNRSEGMFNKDTRRLNPVRKLLFEERRGQYVRFVVSLILDPQVFLVGGPQQV